MPWVPQSTLFRKPGGRDAFVIEDDPKIRAFIARVLVSCGFSAHQFSRISELEAALTVLSPDVIVLDLSLGDSDAVEVMRSLAAVRYHGKVLLMSGHGLGTIDEVRLIGSRLGLAMLPSLHKPFRLEDLKTRLSGVSPIEIRTNGSLLDLGLQNNWLELWYQPKIDLKSMLVCGAEALIRLRHPKDGILDPTQFLPPAGDPLYKPLSDFVVRRALADWRCLAAEQITVRLAINVPASILQDAEFVVNLRRHIPQQREFPGLIVEITEDEAIADPDVAREVAVQLKLYNILMAIDDFGKGYSTLARLHDLPFAEIKADRAFVHGCAADPSKHNMCQKVVDLAHQFKIAAVAEGVENPRDLEALKAMNFDAAQGYLFARPMECGDFIKTLLSRTVERRA